MRRQEIQRMLLFVIFFSVGAGALSGSVLYDDLLQYYINKQVVRSGEESLRRLESLNADYDALLEQLRKDPNILDRIEPAIMGTERQAEDTVYPDVTLEQLEAARAALMEDSNQAPEPAIPDWLARCGKPGRRITLFVAGAFLILISFICFGSGGRSLQKQ